MNKRTFQRRVTKQKNDYKERVFYKCREEMPRSSAIEANVCESSVIWETDSLAEDESKLFLNAMFPENSKFSEKLKTWYIDTKPTKMCVEKLLAILKEEGLDVPLRLETLVGWQTSDSKCDGCAALDKKLDDMKETLEEQQQQTYQQNINICDILAEHKVLLNQLEDKNKAIDTVMQIFPITSESQLHELDNLLTSQKDLYVRYIKSLIKGDISKNLGQILGREIVMSFNVQGVQGKKRLKDFQNVYDAITDAISDERPEEKFKAALHHEKNKNHKLKSKQKAKRSRAQLSVDDYEEPNNK